MKIYTRTDPKGEKKKHVKYAMNIIQIQVSYRNTHKAQACRNCN